MSKLLDGLQLPQGLIELMSASKGWKHSDDASSWIASSEGQAAKKLFDGVMSTSTRLIKNLNYGNGMIMKNGASIPLTLASPNLRWGAGIICPGDKNYAVARSSRLVEVVPAIPLGMQKNGTYLHHELVIEDLARGSYAWVIALLSLVVSAVTLSWTSNWTYNWGLLAGFAVVAYLLWLGRDAKRMYKRWKRYSWSLPLPSDATSVDFEGAESKKIGYPKWAVYLLVVLAGAALLLRSFGQDTPSTMLMVLGILSQLIGLAYACLLRRGVRMSEPFIPYWVDGEDIRYQRFEMIANCVEKESDWRNLGALLVIAGRLKVSLSELTFSLVVSSLES